MRGYNHFQTTRLATFGAMALLAVVATASDDRHQAQGDAGWHEHHSAHEQAREAVEHGLALPLPVLREKLQGIMPSRIVATHYEEEFGRQVYEFKVIDSQGQLHKVHLDARTGELVGITDY